MQKTPRTTPLPKKEAGIKTRKICSTEAEFEELFLPGTHEKKKIQESIREPEKLKERLLKRLRNGEKG